MGFWAGYRVDFQGYIRMDSGFGLTHNEWVAQLTVQPQAGAALDRLRWIAGLWAIFTPAVPH